MNNDKVSVSGAVILMGEDNQKQNSKTGWLTKV
jgi:hypothetical protein